MRNLILLSSVLLITAASAPALTETYGWEGTGTVLGLYGTGNPPMNVQIVTSPVYSGSHSLELEDNSPSQTPQAYIAWVLGLSDGDEVTASFWRYDTTPGSSPSCRIWAHWNDDPGDVMGYNGSAGGNSDYGPGTGWDQTSYTWTVSGGHTGIVIEARTYSGIGDTVWIDDLEVTAPDGTTIYTPDNYTELHAETWGAIKSFDW
jgi:hypothetical protein